jgi:hypothetical protein
LRRALEEICLYEENAMAPETIFLYEENGKNNHWKTWLFAYSGMKCKHMGICLLACYQDNER